jgi:hypothetical protein
LKNAARLWNEFVNGFQNTYTTGFRKEKGNYSSRSGASIGSHGNAMNACGIAHGSAQCSEAVAFASRLGRHLHFSNAEAVSLARTRGLFCLFDNKSHSDRIKENLICKTKNI